MMLWNDILNEIRAIEVPTQSIREMIFACRNHLAYPLGSDALIDLVLGDELLQDTDTAIAWVEDLVPGAILVFRKLSDDRWSASVIRDDIGVGGQAFAAHPAFAIVKAGIEARVDCDLLEETSIQMPDPES